MALSSRAKYSVRGGREGGIYIKYNILRIKLNRISNDCIILIKNHGEFRLYFGYDLDVLCHYVWSIRCVFGIPRILYEVEKSPRSPNRKCLATTDAKTPTIDDAAKATIDDTATTTIDDAVKTTPTYSTCKKGIC